MIAALSQNASIYASIRTLILVRLLELGNGYFRVIIEPLMQSTKNDHFWAPSNGHAASFISMSILSSILSSKEPYGLTCP
jgi:hypothetical protein